MESIFAGLDDDDGMGDEDNEDELQRIFDDYQRQQPAQQQHAVPNNTRKEVREKKHTCTVMTNKFPWRIFDDYQRQQPAQQQQQQHAVPNKTRREVRKKTYLYAGLWIQIRIRI
jgi:chromatin segregation and condensation protein Rec8/ScpA/Scc1 (kleisin family)